MPRKIDGAAVAEKFGDGYRLKLKAPTGEEVYMDLSADAASQLAGQLSARPATPAAEPAPEPRAAAPTSKRSKRKPG